MMSLFFTKINLAVKIGFVAGLAGVRFRLSMFLKLEKPFAEASVHHVLHDSYRAEDALGGMFGIEIAPGQGCLMTVGIPCRSLASNGLAVLSIISLHQR